MQNNDAYLLNCRDEMWNQEIEVRNTTCEKQCKNA